MGGWCVGGRAAGGMAKIKEINHVLEKGDEG